VVLKLLNVQSELLSKSKCYARISKCVLVFVKKVVHVPELSLGIGRLSGLRSIQSVLMDSAQGTVSEHESQFRAEVLLYLLHFRIGCPSVRTLVVAIL